MQTFKANSSKTADAKVRGLATQLLENNAAASSAKKLSDEAKDGLAQWLKDERGFDITKLKAGESILIQVDDKDALLLEAAERPKMVASAEKNLCLFYKPKK